MPEYHFLKELVEQPDAVRETLAAQAERIPEIVAELPNPLSRVIMVACGDPYFVSEAAVYPFEKWAGLPAEAIDGLEFLYWREQLVTEQTLVILISQSGKTIQVVEAARRARARGAAVVSITNSPDSPLAEQSHHLLSTSGGASYSFPTRTTTAAGSLLYALALAIGHARGTVSDDARVSLERLLSEDLPSMMNRALALSPHMEALARSWQQHGHFAFIGTGPGYATARVGAAKINETNRLQAEADELEEYGHLHLFAIQKGTPLLFLAPSERTAERVRAMVEFAVGRGHPIALFCPETDVSRWTALGIHAYGLPAIDELLSPFLYVLPLQLFAYHLAVTRGCDPDRPVGFDNVAIQKMIYTGLLEGWHDQNPSPAGGT